MDKPTREILVATLLAAASKLEGGLWDHTARRGGSDKKKTTPMRRTYDKVKFASAVDAIEEIQEKFFNKGSVSLDEDNFGQIYITIYTSVKVDPSGRKYEMKENDFDETDDDYAHGSRKEEEEE